MKIQESAENYLETILILSRTNPAVRSIDVVNELGFSKPSVSVAMKRLRENGYVNMDDRGFLTLTDAGREIAEGMYERHKFLSKFFMELGVPEDIAVNDACRIEHIISAETFEKLKAHGRAMSTELRRAADDGERMRRKSSSQSVDAEA